MARLEPRDGIFPNYYGKKWGLQSYHVSVSRFRDEDKHTGTSNWRRNPGCLQRRDHDILRTQRRRIFGRLDLAFELGVPDPQGQAVSLHRFEMLPAHHAGNVMTGPREPHREMAADGARTENTYPH